MLHPACGKELVYIYIYIYIYNLKGLYQINHVMFLALKLRLLSKKSNLIELCKFVQMSLTKHREIITFSSILMQVQALSEAF